MKANSLCHFPHKEAFLQFIWNCYSTAMGTYENVMAIEQRIRCRVGTPAKVGAKREEVFQFSSIPEQKCEQNEQEWLFHFSSLLLPLSLGYICLFCSLFALSLYVYTLPPRMVISHMVELWI